MYVFKVCGPSTDAHAGQQVGSPSKRWLPNPHTARNHEARFGWFPLSDIRWRKSSNQLNTISHFTTLDNSEPSDHPRCRKRWICLRRDCLRLADLRRRIPRCREIRFLDREAVRSSGLGTRLALSSTRISVSWQILIFFIKVKWRREDTYCRGSCPSWTGSYRDTIERSSLSIHRMSSGGFHLYPPYLTPLTKCFRIYMRIISINWSLRNWTAPLRLYRLPTPRKSSNRRDTSNYIPSKRGRNLISSKTEIKVSPSQLCLENILWDFSIKRMICSMLFPLSWAVWLLLISSPCISREILSTTMNSKYPSPPRDVNTMSSYILPLLLLFWSLWMILMEGNSPSLSGD